MVRLQETVKKYMNPKLVVVTPNATIAQVAKGMVEKDTDIAIVKEGNEIFGVITDSDIFHSMKTYVLQDVLENLPKDVGRIRVEQIMDGTLSKDFMSVCQLTGLRPCLMLGEDETVEVAIKTMGASEAHHLLIVGPDGSLTGSLSAHDLMKSFAD